MAHKESIVIANCGGFWGDDPRAARRQLQGPVDYLVMDYLAEVTMAILQKQRQRDPARGFAPDFITQLRDVLVDCVDRGVKIISNAGGVNPRACGAAVQQLAEDLGVADRVTVGVVLGDDIYPELDDVVAGGEQLANMETGAPLDDIRDRVLSANVYLGAAPVVAALEAGANVIVAGRITDTGVTLAPMIHEFGWAADDWDRLAAGIVAGHVIECGTQCTGGNFTDWHLVPSFTDMGYPLVQVEADGSFVVTKHPGTGGIVTTHTVTEQLLYEMGAPTYVSPDCLAHFDSIELEQVGPDRVRVTGVRGEPFPDSYKVSISYADGFRAFGRLLLSAPEVRAKATRVAEATWHAVGGTDLYDDTSTQLIGWDATHPPLVDGEPGEALLQFAVRDGDRTKIETRFCPQIVPRTLGSVPGITALADQGRPRTSEVVGYWPALLPRDRVRVRVEVDGVERAVEVPAHAPDVDARSFTPASVESRDVTPRGATQRVPLGRLCLARSGDKGDTSNIGLVARSVEIHAWMLAMITTDFVRHRFADVCRGEVERFEVPNLLAVNFLLHHSLGGGGTESLFADAQGKTYAQFLLATTVEVDEALLDTLP